MRGVTGNTRAALRAHLDTIAAAPASTHRAWENEGFKPSSGVAWLRETHAPFSSQLESIPAPGGLVEHNALWFLDLFVPARAGTDEGDDTADAIVAGYWPGLILSAGGQAVTVVSSKRAKGAPDSGNSNWYMVPITIEVRANTRNPD